MIYVRAIQSYCQTLQVISFVAEEAEAKGLYEDAIRLYDLAKVGVSNGCGLLVEVEAKGLWHVVER